MKERFLPIGTVVLLTGGTKEVMITGYCIFPKNRQASTEKPKMYEYGACTYPEGILDSNMTCAFNHNQIAKVVYLGYESEEQKKLSEMLNSSYEEYKSKYENGTIQPQ